MQNINIKLKALNLKPLFKGQSNISNIKIKAILKAKAPIYNGFNVGIACGKGMLAMGYSITRQNGTLMLGAGSIAYLISYMQGSAGHSKPAQLYAIAYNLHLSPVQWGAALGLSACSFNLASNAFGIKLISGGFASNINMHCNCCNCRSNLMGL